MSVVVADTSVWSRFFRSDISVDDPHVAALSREVEQGTVVTTGVIYLELLRGFTRKTTREQLEREFDALSFVEPTREDYFGAADLNLTCRRAGVQLGTIDSLIAQLCIARGLTLLTSDRDFTDAADVIPFDVWNPE